MSWIITLSKNGGSFTQNSVEVNSITVEANATYLLGLNNLGVSNEVYSFMGWYLEPSFITEVTLATLAIADTTVYAKWGVLVDFVKNGGSCTEDGLDVDSVLIPINSTYASVLESGNFSVFLTGHTFLGWYLDVGLTSELNLTSVATATTTAYMSWGLTVTLALDGGTCLNSSGVSVTSITVDPGQLYLPQLGGYTVTKVGYTLLGWYFKATYLIQITPETIETNANTHSIYAKWGLNVTISFNKNGGIWTGLQPTSVGVTVGGLYGDLPGISVVTRSDCDFIGWYSDITNNKKITATSVVEPGVIELLSGWIISAASINNLTASLLASQKVLNNLTIDYNSFENINERVSSVEELVREGGTYSSEGTLLPTGTLRVTIDAVSAQLTTAPGDVYSQTEAADLLRNLEGEI